MRCGRALAAEPPERIRNDIESAQGLLAQDYVGVTTNGTPATGLFSIEKIGLSTDGIKNAADAWRRYPKTKGMPQSFLWTAMLGAAGATFILS